MKVGIDARSLHRGPSGVATYVGNLLDELIDLDAFAPRFPSNNLAWNTLRVPAAQLRHRWDLFHAPSYTAPLISFCPVVLSVHDICYLARPQWYPYRLDRWRLGFYRASLRRAHRVLVPTDFSSSEIVRLMPALEQRVRRVYLGVGSSFHPDVNLAEQVRQRYELPRDFLLHVGDIHPRRNIPLLAQAARDLRLPLVLIGRRIQGPPIEDAFLKLSGLSQEELRGFYSAASLLVYPSLYEGFGLPLIEAMACGLPVVAVHRSCFPEVVGEAGVLVEPTQAALRSGIQEALGRREELAQKGLQRARLFNWRETARQTREVYREVLPNEQWKKRGDAKN
jgi:glycosyltransferase involved in cell wall biosynthesis